jgi:hypothetical protein
VVEKVAQLERAFSAQSRIILFRATNRRAAMISSNYPTEITRRRELITSYLVIVVWS